MTQTICRMYSSSETARAAAEELDEFRQLAGVVHVIDASGEDASIEAIASEISRLNVSRATATAYAQRIQDGAALVVVQAPLFSGDLVETCLDQHQPIPLGIAEEEEEPERFLWDEAAPFSSAFRIPVKSSTPYLFSTFWNLPLLKHDPAALREGMETIRFLSSRAGMFSGLFGFRMLSNAATPVSDFLGLPVLSKDAAPFSSALKLPTKLKGKE